MKKLVYILLAFVVFLSFTAVNIFAGEVDKAKEAEKIFEKAIAQDNDCNLSIDAQNVSDDEMKSVVGERDPLDPGLGYGISMTIAEMGDPINIGQSATREIVKNAAKYKNTTKHKENNKKKNKEIYWAWNYRYYIYQITK